MEHLRLACLVALLPLGSASAQVSALKIYPIPVNTAADEDEPFIADNGLTLYFCSNARPGKEDFMTATRRVAEPFLSATAASPAAAIPVRTRSVVPKFCFMVPPCPFRLPRSVLPQENRQGACQRGSYAFRTPGQGER